MKTDNTAKNNVVTEEELESFDAILAEALGEVSTDALQNEQFGEEEADIGGDADLGGGDIDIEGGEAEGGASSIEDLVEQLRDIVEQIAAEVGVGAEDEDEDFDDNFEDENVDDDLSEVPTEAKGSKGHPIKGKGSKLQSKCNKVPAKPHTNTGKASKTAVQGHHGQVGNAPKSNLSDKSKQKVQGQKTPGTDLF